MRSTQVALLALLPAFVVACDGARGGAKVHEKYTCPMHPQYVSDKPGNCPICGMKLVPVGSAGALLIRGPLRCERLGETDRLEPRRCEARTPKPALPDRSGERHDDRQLRVER